MSRREADLYRALTERRKLVSMASKTKAIDTGCPHCRRQIPRKRWVKTGAQLMHAARRTPPGAPKKERPCPHCGESKGVAEMRLHIPVCAKRPAELTAAMRIAEREARGQ